MIRSYTLLLSLLFIFVYPNYINATVFNAIADGNWNEPTVWDQGSVPGSLDTVVIDGYSVTIDDLTGNVAVKHLILTNASNAWHSQLLIMGAVTVIVMDNLEATAENISKDVEVAIQDNATLNVNGNVNFIRVNTNNTTSKLLLYLRHTSRMNVGGNFTYDCKNARFNEVNNEIFLEESAILDITGNTYLYMRGGKDFDFLMQWSAQAILRGDLDAQITGGDKMTITSMDNTHFQLTGNASITNSGGTTHAMLHADGSTGTFSIDGNLNLISTIADKIVYVEATKANNVINVAGDISMSALSEGDVYIELKESSNLYLGGDFLRPTNYGALLMGATSTLTYNGTQSQVLADEDLAGSGTDAFNFTNIDVNNPSGFVLEESLYIVNNLNLTTGIITTTSTNLLTVGDSATITGGSVTAYIDGPMIKEGRTLGDQFVFPIGDGSLYAPMGISKISSSSSQYTAQAFGDPPPFGNSIAPDVGNISENQYWELTKTPGSEDVDVKLYWMDADANDINNLDSVIVVGLNESNIWQNFGNGGTTGGTGSGVSGSVSSADGDPPPFGVTKFTIGSLPPVAPKIYLPSGLNGVNGASELLPVELTHFYVLQQKDKVFLRWQTASEINTMHFEIERSIDGINFERIGIIRSKENSANIQNYSAYDAAPNMGSNYYRLKIVDFDGYYEYSRAKEVEFDQTQKLKIYPNPANRLLHIQGDNSLDEEGVLEVFNANGRRIYAGKFVWKHGRLRISVEEINTHAPGTYFIRFTTDSGSHVLKFNKH